MTNKLEFKDEAGKIVAVMDLDVVPEILHTDGTITKATPKKKEHGMTIEKFLSGAVWLASTGPGIIIAISSGAWTGLISGVVTQGLLGLSIDWFLVWYGILWGSFFAYLVIGLIYDLKHG